MSISSLEGLLFPIVDGEPQQPNPELRVEERVLILGTNLSGARNLANDADVILRNQGLQVKVQKIRDPELIKVAFFGIKPSDLEGILQGNNPEFTLPRLVIAFPEMRAEDDEGTGMVVTTPIDYIQGLCKDYNVPFKYFQSYNVTPEDYRSGIVGMLPADV
jgi:hypothetical protein